jgi:hypothetical protein
MRRLEVLVCGWEISWGCLGVIEGNEGGVVKGKELIEVGRMVDFMKVDGMK